MRSGIEDAIRRAALEAGFELSGIAAVGNFPELARFPEWIAAGRAGEMKYLESRDEAGNLRRASLGSVFPWARSVTFCAINYNKEQRYWREENNSANG